MNRLPGIPRPRFGLLARFALASFVAVALLGVVLAHTFAHGVRSRALADARRTANLVDDSLVRPQIKDSDLATGLSPERVTALDRALAAGLTGGQVARIKIWNSDSRVVYATDHSIIGKRFPTVDDELEEALDGETASDVDDLRKAENAGDRHFGQLLEVYTPIRSRANGRVVGAFELYLPYRPIAAGIAHDTQRLYLFLAAGLTLLYLLLFRIVAGASTRLRRQAAENQHLALHDPLTDLPNRSLFHDRAQQAILASRRDQTGIALMILDLDRFKEVNDTLGHHNGDLLLQEIGARLRGGLRESDSVARLGGDEFGLLLPNVADGAEALMLGERVRAVLRRPFTLEGVTLDVEASIGIAIYPEHGDDVDSLLQRADVAMYLAKEDRSGCELYASDRDEYSPHRLALAAELRRALDEKELVLHYQPKADLSDGRIVAVEALVRWQHPEHGLLTPDQFVPLAEATGLIRELTLTVLAEALHQQRVWRDDGIDIRVAVNLSARDLYDLTLPASTAELLAKHDVPPTSLELEITESVIVADPMRARAILNRLSEMGVVLAIDDYGTGYSSLGYLKRLPIDEMKIDRSFVMQMADDRNDAAIVRSTVELGRNLGLKVVAEGVETAAAWAHLKALGCDFAQGYYLSKPVPAAEIAALVAAGGSSPARAATS
ncbi:MAG TPA: EAL domain-containing protein [Gaiellaceae bacterium]|nr:EAL domain-containing protein [Gaiellaceae bacterium]